jgi:DNA-binding PadR family transcriptional regulator
MPLHREDWTTKNKTYETELRRLRALGLIKGSVGDYFRAGDDAHKHLQITEDGIKYLRARAEQTTQVAPSEGHSQ